MNTPTRAPITPLPPASLAPVAGEARAPEAHAQAHPRAGIPQIGPIDKMMGNGRETGDPTEGAPAPLAAPADPRPQPIASALQALPTHRGGGGTSRGPDAAPAAPAEACSGILRELAELPADTALDAVQLGRLIGRHPKTIQRSVRRGDLPAPMLMFRRQFWLAGAIIEHFRARQAAALKAARRA